jgi:SagB-type dehydrogenase family enzyme
VTEVRHMESHGLRYQQKMRAFPSGGGLYPIEVYPILTNCETPSGLYHYNVPEHAIERLRGPFEESELRRLTSFDGLLESAALILVFSAVFARTYFKYHERGYRFALLEAGHLAENFYLQATAMNLAVVALGGILRRRGEPRPVDRRRGRSRRLRDGLRPPAGVTLQASRRRADSPVKVMRAGARCDREGLQSIDLDRDDARLLLQRAYGQQKRFMDGDEAVFFENARRQDQVRDARLVLQGDEAETLCRAGPLPRGRPPMPAGR